MSDLAKKTGGSYTAADNRISWEVVEDAQDWQVGAAASFAMINHEDAELRELKYDVLPSPHNKRGPKSGKNSPFDACEAGWDGRALWQSYADDPPIGDSLPAPQPGGFNADSAPQQVTSGFGA
jgi:hypothetical protein